MTPPPSAAAVRARVIRRRVKDTLRQARTSARARALCAAHIDALGADSADELAGIRVGELLVACRGVGPAHRDQLLAAAAASLDRPAFDRDRRLRSLTARERDALITALLAKWPREREHPLVALATQELAPTTARDARSPESSPNADPLDRAAIQKGSATER